VQQLGPLCDGSRFQQQQVVFEGEACCESVDFVEKQQRSTLAVLVMAKVKARALRRREADDDDREGDHGVG